MHAAIQLVVFWALAFLTLGMALVLLNIFFGVIGNDLVLRSAGSEAVIAGVCSLIEALSFWVVATYVPAASRGLVSRGLIIPMVIVALIYKVAHYEDWGRIDLFMLLAFQAVLGFWGVALFLGHIQTALLILVGFGAVLSFIALSTKGLWD